MAAPLASRSFFHQVTETELPQYIEYAISRFDLRSYTVITILMSVYSAWLLSVWDVTLA